MNVSADATARSKMNKLVENSLPRGRQDLDLLLEVSEELTRTVALNEVTGPVLQRMAARMGMLRGTITILNRATGAIVIEDAFGLSPHEMERGRYALGEGITGRVIATGEPAIVPDVVDEPLFLDRTRARRRNRR